MPTDTVLAKAERLHLNNAVTKTGDEFQVVGDHSTYTVTLLGGEACTCPAGRNHRRCSHVEAVWLEIRYGGLRRAVAAGRARTVRYELDHQETP